MQSKVVKIFRIILHVWQKLVMISSKSNIFGLNKSFWKILYKIFLMVFLNFYKNGKVFNIQCKYKKITSCFINWAIKLVKLLLSQLFKLFFPYLGYKYKVDMYLLGVCDFILGGLHAMYVIALQRKGKNVFHLETFTLTPVKLGVLETSIHASKM